MLRTLAAVVGRTPPGCHEQVVKISWRIVRKDEEERNTPVTFRLRNLELDGARFRVRRADKSGADKSRADKTIAVEPQLLQLVVRAR